MNSEDCEDIVQHFVVSFLAVATALGPENGLAVRRPGHSEDCEDIVQHFDL